MSLADDASCSSGSTGSTWDLSDESMDPSLDGDPFHSCANVVDVVPPVLHPSADTFPDDDSLCSAVPSICSQGSQDAPVAANGSRHQLAPFDDVLSSCAVHQVSGSSARLDSDLFSTAHAQIDTGADISCTDLKYLLTPSLLNSKGSTTELFLVNFSVLVSPVAWAQAMQWSHSPSLLLLLLLFIMLASRVLPSVFDALPLGESSSGDLLLILLCLMTRMLLLLLCLRISHPFLPLLRLGS